ncbi:MAG TPA: M3 family metallopeptidase, partial [Candidatus Saccharimonadales bacterium]|nr:M3 family metallopeptidase [Candidatus Saccharimonadales bacterium]
IDYTAITPSSVESATEDALRRANRLVDEAASGATAGDDAPSFKRTLRPLDEALGEAAVGFGRGAFMGHVHPDREVRDAGSAAEERLAKWRVELPFRDDLYRAVRAFAETPEAAALRGERQRLLDHWLREFRRAGQELSESERAELRALRARLVELEVTFQRNIGEFHDHLELTREELDGLPDSYVERLRPGSRADTYLVSLEYPDVVPFMEQAQRRDLRERLEFKEWTKALETNQPVLAQALSVRRRVAELLGYPSWAHYAIEVRMAKEPAAVRRLYEELVPAVTLKASDERAELTAALLAETGDDVLRPWDFRYYDAQLRRTTYGVDSSTVAEYFPLGQVMDGLLELTGDVFGLSFRLVEDARAWHPDVRLYEISDRGTGRRLGYAYTDLFPREGKFTHAAAFPLVVAHRNASGRRVTPISAIVANFTPPSGDRPALLRHDEVTTLFHEFGHILHMSLSQAEFVRFSGAETESDFVEAPSQIMEHWSWNADILRRFARHYRTEEPIPVELVDQLVAARNLDVASKALRQVYFGQVDLAFHGEEEPVDLHAIDRASYAVTGLPFHEDTFFAASFGHLMGGYDAGYYGYLWSKVFGDDMFSRFEAEGITSRAVGSDYRRHILEPNGSDDAETLLRRFLGREPSNAAFLRQLGLTEVEA